MNINYIKLHNSLRSKMFPKALAVIIFMFFTSLTVLFLKIEGAFLILIVIINIICAFNLKADKIATINTKENLKIVSKYNIKDIDEFSRNIRIIKDEIKFLKFENEEDYINNILNKFYKNIETEDETEKEILKKLKN